jgi:hypothetical protein
MLSSAALDAAIEALPEEGDTLPLRLSPAVAALQCAISTGVLREDHVAVQSMYRLCLQLFKAERSVPPETFDALRSLDETMLVNHGQSGLNMLRGKGGGQAGVHANANVVVCESTCKRDRKRRSPYAIPYLDSSPIGASVVSSLYGRRGDEPVVPSQVRVGKSGDFVKLGARRLVGTRSSTIDSWVDYAGASSQRQRRGPLRAWAAHRRHWPLARPRRRRRRHLRWG